MRRYTQERRQGLPGRRTTTKATVGNPYSQTKRELIDRAEADLRGGGRVAEWARRAFEALPSSDDGARSGFPGEIHAVLKLPNGRPGVANYMGPGTALVERIKRGDPPRTLSDKVAQRHDIDYSFAKGQSDVAKADARMVSKLKAIGKAKGDSMVNVQMGMRPIQLKMLAESSGIVRPGRIAEIGGIPNKDMPLLSAKRSELDQEGFGVRPGDLLRKEIMDSMKKAKKKKMKGGRAPTASTVGNKTMYGGRAPTASTVGNKTMYGGRAPHAYVDDTTGAVIVGGGIGSTATKAIRTVGKVGKHMASVANDIYAFITKHQLPQLFSDMSGIGLGLSGKGLRLAGQGIVKDVGQAIMQIIMRVLGKQKLTGKGKFSRALGSLAKSAKPIAKGVASLILPILVGIAKNSIEKRMSGSGGGTVNGVPMDEYMRRVANPSMLSKLNDFLASALWKGIKKMLAPKATAGAGIGLAGGSFASFWKGFKKGFGDVFNAVGSVAKVAGPLIPLLL